MDSSIFVAKVADLPPGKCRVVQVGKQPVAVFNIAGQFHAIVDYCSHRAGPLSEGTLEGRIVTCPWHGATFDVTTGEPTGGPAVRKLGCFPVTVRGDEIHVG